MRSVKRAENKRRRLGGSRLQGVGLQFLGAQWGHKSLRTDCLIYFDVGNSKRFHNFLTGAFRT
jgi:hypothetical protein